MKHRRSPRDSGHASLPLLRALALFAAPALLSSPQTPGGPPGGPGGNWIVEYNANGGKVAVNGSPLSWTDRIQTDANGWYSIPNYVGGYDHPGTIPPSLMSTTVTSAGSPKIRLRWSGSGSPPIVAWLLVDSSATWTSTNGSGASNNGFASDQPVAVANGQRRSGKHVIRLRGENTREWSATVSATATATSMASEQQSAAADVKLIGSVTDKNAKLERVGGGDVYLQGNDYTSHTLLSWSASDGISPGPNVQGLTGSYGGTWSKKADGANDVSVVWSGASTGGFTPTPANLTPSAYAPSLGGTMPYADGSGKPKTQDWKYSVRDNVDGTDLALTFRWICHYAFEDFNPYPPDPDSGTFRPGETRYERVFESGEVGNVAITAGSLSAKTDYEADGTHSGVPKADKYVGIPAYQARAGRTNSKSWGASSYPVTATVAGSYGYRYYKNWKGHVGTVVSWNKAGDQAVLVFAYLLDNEASFDEEPIKPQGTL